MATDPIAKLPLEAALSNRLKGLQKAEIAAVALAIDQLGRIGFDSDDVFVTGSNSDPDGVELRGQVAADNIGDLTELIPVLNPSSVKIFPRGIVKPDRYRVHLKLDRR